MKNLRYPLAIDGAGNAVTTDSTAQTMRDKIAVLLATMPDERPEDQSYGARVSAALFESIDDVEALVTEQVGEAFQRYLPEVTLADVDVLQDPTDESRIVLTLTFSTPDNEEETVSTVIDLQ